MTSLDELLVYLKTLFPLSPRFLRLQREYLEQKFLCLTADLQDEYIKLLSEIIETSEDARVEAVLRKSFDLSCAGVKSPIAVLSLGFWDDHIEWCQKRKKSWVFKTPQD